MYIYMNQNKQTRGSPHKGCSEESAKPQKDEAPYDSRSDLRCSKTYGFVHQHLAPSVGIDTKSYIGSFSFFHLRRGSADNQPNNSTPNSTS
ncbi:hypothetical protein DVH24_007523 [Malus domestica]|uniref:Uncharacterized protein n=1 Tax=Malus domestica TaxID=3750 RepID=A0A498HLJ9_MALDO|nr:hypothetical protein DVH24_007523 [Malus domestica]